MKTISLTLAGAVAILALTANGLAQPQPFERLPPERFDATPPSARVDGPPGQMSVQSSACRNLPTGETRRRIVDVAVQEWGFFGFSMVDQTHRGASQLSKPVSMVEAARRPHRGGPRSIDHRRLLGGDAAGILDGRSSEREVERSGWPGLALARSLVRGIRLLGDVRGRTRRLESVPALDRPTTSTSIKPSAARDAGSSEAAFTAYDVGDTAVEPGDLLCSSRRNSYASIAQRRRHLGVGARMHCDIVVKLEPDRGRIVAIGGNVRGTVSLKLLPAAPRGGHLAPARAIFAHLKLRADTIEADALNATPTFQALECTPGIQPPAGLAALTTSTTPIHHRLLTAGGGTRVSAEAPTGRTGR